MIMERGIKHLDCMDAQLTCWQSMLGFGLLLMLININNKQRHGQADCTLPFTCRGILLSKGHRDGCRIHLNMRNTHTHKLHPLITWFPLKHLKALIKRAISIRTYTCRQDIKHERVDLKSGQRRQPQKATHREVKKKSSILLSFFKWSCLWNFTPFSYLLICLPT